MGNIYLCPKEVFYYIKSLKQLKTKGRVWMTSFSDDWFYQYLVSIKLFTTNILCVCKVEEVTKDRRS